MLSCYFVVLQTLLISDLSILLLVIYFVCFFLTLLCEALWAAHLYERCHMNKDELLKAVALILSKAAGLTLSDSILHPVQISHSLYPSVWLKVSLR